MSRQARASNPTLLTPREAAARLGVSYQTVKHWIYQGAVRTTRTAGGHHRIAIAEVERLLARRDDRPPRSARRRRGWPRAGALVAISGRNQLAGYVEEVRVDRLLAQVRLRIGDQTLTAIITRDAVEELRLKRGDEALAIIKATEVMIARASS
ncbi:MAG: TOBE domain-containing protein [Vicinamibacterales bacterium]